MTAGPAARPWFAVSIELPDQSIAVATFRDPKDAHEWKKTHAETLRARYSTLKTIVVVPVSTSTTGVPT